jgi:hypothetical protein
MRTIRRATAVPLPVDPDDLADDDEATVDDPLPREGDAARHRRIAERAYGRAERRGFAPGGELDDWLAAEAEERGEANDGGR